VQAIVLLCDHAEAFNGKLYTMGAGWSNVLAAQPLSFTVAVRIAVPWTAANKQHHILLGLETEDGTLVMSEDQPEEQVRIEGDFEVGRPPGLKPGTDLVNVLAVPFSNLDLAAGGYAVVLRIDGTEIARATFNVERKDDRT
jgi:hypothetical protein